MTDTWRKPEENNYFVGIERESPTVYAEGITIYIRIYAHDSRIYTD